MQTIQLKVDNDYINIVLTILNNLKNDIIKDISIFKEDKNIDSLSKFMAIDHSINNDKVKDFLKLGGSGCWSGNLEDMRSDRIDYGSNR